MASTIDERPPHMQKKRKKKRKNVLVKEREFLLGLEYTHNRVCVGTNPHDPEGSLQRRKDNYSSSSSSSFLSFF